MTASNPLRLVTVTHFFPAHGGGLELVAGRLIEEFSKRGVEVTWFSSDTDAPPSAVGDRIRHVPVRTWNIIERLTQLPYPIWSPTALPKLWRAIGAADAVHIHEHLYPSSIAATLIARLRKRPVVITQHMGALGLPNPLLTALYERGARFLGRLIFPLAARRVFISANVRNFFHREADQSSLLIFNGIDTSRFVPEEIETSRTRQSLGLPDAGPVVLFVGRLVRKKGLHIIAQVARRLPSVNWVIIGSGPENPHEWQLKNVQALGRKSHDELPDYFRHADLLMLPSSGEGFPLVVQEAICCGTGILSTEEVATACPPVSDLIRSCPTPRGEPDIDLWTAATQAALADTDYMQSRKLRANAGRKIWSWQYCAKQYLDIFRNVSDTAAR